MNSHKPESPLDQEEQNLAAQLRALSSAQPSERIDRAILAMASEAAEPLPVKSRRGRWFVPLGLAASSVIAATLVWQIQPYFGILPNSTESDSVLSESSEQPASSRMEVELLESSADRTVQSDVVNTTAPPPERTQTSPGSESAKRATAQRARPSAMPAAAPTDSAGPSSPTEKLALERPSAAQQRAEQARAQANQAETSQRESMADSAAMSMSQESELNVSGSRMANDEASRVRDEVDRSLQEVRRLIARGQRLEARNLLLKLKRDNPEIEIPEDLRNLLR